MDTPDPDKSVPGGGGIAGIGYIAGVRAMVTASDSGIDAGAMQHMGLEKSLRAQEVALENKLPFVQLVESAGANLLKYRVEQFVRGGSLFRNLARLSAAGLPVVTVTHGSSTPEASPAERRSNSPAQAGSSAEKRSGAGSGSAGSEPDAACGNLRPYGPGCARFRFVFISKRLIPMRVKRVPGWRKCSGNTAAMRRTSSLDSGWGRREKKDEKRAADRLPFA
jgi:hypothetical protein